MAIHVIIPVIFPAYKSPLSENMYVVCEFDKIVDGHLALIHKSRVHCLIHSDRQLFLDISRNKKPVTQADFFPFCAMYSINKRLKTREMMQRREKTDGMEFHFPYGKKARELFLLAMG